MLLVIIKTVDLRLAKSMSAAKNVNEDYGRTLSGLRQ